MVNWHSKRLTALLWLAIVLTSVVLINALGQHYYTRIDLTEEGRYTITEPTREMLRGLDDVVYVDVYLDGDMPAGFQRLKRSIRETLEEFRVHGGRNLQYQFIDPWQAESGQARQEFFKSLSDLGIQPINAIDPKADQRTEKYLFPGAVISFGGQELGVMLLNGSKGASAQEQLNQSVEGVEYELASAISKLTTVERETIGILRGHGELSGLEITGVVTPLTEFYNVLPVTINGQEDLRDLDALIVAKPVEAFTESEKYYLDQYLMRGGNMLWCLDLMEVYMDSAGGEGTASIPYELNLEDQLFRYGLRINYDLIADAQSGSYPAVAGELNGQPQIRMMPWPFFVLANNYATHPITSNLDAVYARFVSTIDTIMVPGVAKTLLIQSSPYSKVMGSPVRVNINDMRGLLDQNSFSGGPQPFAYLLEGKFPSLYRNRLLPEGIRDENFLADGAATGRLIVVADGDILRNEVNPRTGEPLPLGMDPFLQEQFANQDFLLNSIAYLLDADGIINARNKEIKIRPLDPVKLENERSRWQFINLVVPILVLVLFGIFKWFLRRRNFSRKYND